MRTFILFFTIGILVLTRGPLIPAAHALTSTYAQIPVLGYVGGGLLLATGLANNIQGERLLKLALADSAGEPDLERGEGPGAEQKNQISQKRLSIQKCNTRLGWVATLGMVFLAGDPLMMFEDLTKEEALQLSIEPGELEDYRQFRSLMNARLESIADEMGNVPQGEFFNFVQEASRRWKEDEKIPLATLRAGAKIMVNSLQTLLADGGIRDCD